MSNDYDVLVIGKLFCDVIFTGLPHMPELGRELYAAELDVAAGGSFIVAGAMHRLGLQVGLVADLGNDFFSQALAQLIEEEGVDTTLIRRHPEPLPQVSVALSFPHERAFITKLSSPPAPLDVADLLARHPARHVHIYGLGAGLRNPDLPRLAHDAGLTVSMDCGWDESLMRDPRIRELMTAVDVFMPNAAEACFLTGSDDPEAALRELARQVPTVVVKLGSDGVLAQSGDQFECVPALSVTPVDTTGAGDAFAAGFIYASLNEMPLRDCLRYGSVCGGLATTAAGGATAAPTLEEVRSWLSRLP